MLKLLQDAPAETLWVSIDGFPWIIWQFLNMTQIYSVN